MLLLLVLACSPSEEPICAEFSPAVVTPANALHNEDSCGHWSVAVGDYLVVSVEMTEPDLGCDMTLGDGLELQYDPTYSNLEDNATFEGGPKWTWQVFGATPTTGSSVEVMCEEGTSWAAMVDVVE